MRDKRLKVAFVTVRYGKEINGGAEFHCRMLAERLKDMCDVEVITTCVKNYVDGSNEYSAGTDELNGVPIRRFPVSPIRTGRSETHYLHRSRPAKRMRRFLYRIGLLKYLSYIFPVWKWGFKADMKAMERSVFFSHAMNDYIEQNRDNYDVFIAVTAEYAPFYFTALHAGGKMIAIPTLHDTYVSYRPYMTGMFSRIRYVGFNTESEWNLARNLFGKALHDSGIISVGIESPEPADWETVKEKFGLPDKYICYIGRIEMGKVGRLLDYYSSYHRQKSGCDIPLVMVGQVFQDVGTFDNVIYTGFVTDEEKRAILQHAMLLINPSMYESLSLILLEALNDSIPVLVNGHCDVLKEHCEKSGGAVKYYMDESSFCKTLDQVLSDRAVYDEMARKGNEYFLRNYDWNIIMERLYRAIEHVSGNMVGR